MASSLLGWQGGRVAGSLSALNGLTPVVEWCLMRQPSLAPEGVLSSD
jgi:hypothetical protein